MGELIDKTKGAANEVIGKAKVAVGQHTDSPELIAKGANQRIKGQAQKALGAIKGAVGNKV